MGGCLTVGTPACGGVRNADICCCYLTLHLLPPRRLLQTAHLMAPRQQAAVVFRLEKKRLLAGAIAKSKRRLSKKQA